MTAPIWMAAPPEVHSALLSSGPGSASLLAAAGAWTTLSAEYASVAEELIAVLANVQAGVWEGPSAESFVAAHVPYLVWLAQASTNSAASATQHEAAAAAHTAALAAMPTLAELATNHVIHAVLVATNFFGLNTIPIALNEADYVRMWIQAATTMSIYQALAGSAVASTPQTESAPPILKASAAQTGTGSDSEPTPTSTGLGTLLQSLLQKLGVSDQFVDNFGIDNIYDFLNNPVAYTESHAIYRLLTDPLAVLENPLYLFYDGDEVFFPLGQAILPASALSIAPVGSLGSLATLAAAAAPLPAATAVAPALASFAPAPAPAVLPAAGPAPTTVASAVAPGTVPAPAPTASTVASFAQAPPTAGGAGFVPPYAVGPHGIGFGWAPSAGISSSAKSKAPQADAAVAAAVATAREQARTRRRVRAKQRGFSDEFMDMDVEVDPDWGAPPPEEAVASTLASDRGAATLGFAGTVSKDSARAAGLTTLSGDEFDGGPRMPMLPKTWNPETPDGER